MIASTQTSPPRAVAPPEKAVLLNPGPVNVHSQVRDALAYPDVCHREPESIELLTRAREKATLVCGGDDAHTSVLLSGSGTAALEAALSSIVAPDGKILVLDNGNYGERIHRIVAAHGIAGMRLEFGWTTPIDVDAVDAALTADPAITHVGMVHHETSTGMLNPLREIGAVVAKHGRSLVVDAISSVGSEDFDMRLDNVDWCVGTANKCLEGLPGISFVCAPRAALDALADVPPRTFYLDLHGHYVAQDKDKAPLFTPAMQVLYAFDAALDIALREGVSARAARYGRLAEQVRAGFTQRGLRFLLPADQRANSVTHLHVPDGITYEELHDGLKAAGFVIYGVQKRLGAVFRVANMGQLDEQHIAEFFAAFDRVLDGAGASV
ncbi:pyridoxal-phosphate-dependent aminotransferase family protein [Saccharopolyspora phatthalungensis]|uniref:2-aminoethylphosphonate--pyruvate transaminase n=1 Tax=Saccharopolyspora phatthalungensis TaxID=664693 RepID=A0A840QJN3_9PSEU|nr:aminotransferase class V-fold PLP-dependent enzyme [Saccharopolyspora phatthalungensis]MBB5159498.1 2-aminoethylphosphonate-pyruvate transaminase [Saccharopolyspora phatthalungensis]